jgi:hypothetical protein
MRLVLALFVIAACGGKPSAAPAWPKTADKEVDGGESLEPRAKASAVAATTKKDDEPVVATPVTDKPAPEKPKTDAETPKPATTTGSTPATEEEIVITTEEIVIEIED